MPGLAIQLCYILKRLIELTKLFDDNGEITEKFAYQLYWLVKGHFGNNPRDAIMRSANSYFKRVWYDYEGICIDEYLEGFEEAYEKELERRLTETKK